MDGILNVFHIKRGFRRVAQVFDLAGTLALGGAPSFAHFAKGGSWNVHTMGRTHVASTASRPALAKNARTGYPQSCNRRGNQNRRPGHPPAVPWSINVAAHFPQPAADGLSARSNTGSADARVFGEYAFFANGPDTHALAIALE